MIYEKEFNYILHLLRCAVSNEIPPNPNKDLDWEVIFQMAKKHRILSTLSFGLQKLPESIQTNIPHFNNYFLEYQKNLILDANRSFEIELLKKQFEEHKIDYVLLKGSVTKYLYPDTSMRVMSDIDIFYRIPDVANQTIPLISIMENMGYKVTSKEPKEIAFSKPLVAIARPIRIEMQTALIDEGYGSWFSYLNNIWDRLLQKNNSHEYIMSDEDLYIYHIIHMAKHFKNGGIGLIHILDVWMIRHRYPNMNTTYINKELEKNSLLKFEQNINLLANYWFAPKTPRISNYDQTTIILLRNYIISGGAFGTKPQQETNRIVDRNGTKVSLTKKIFPGKEIMIDYYGNILKRHPWLIPLYWIRLNFKRVFFARETTKKNYKAIIQISSSKIELTKELMERCGL